MRYYHVWFSTKNRKWLLEGDVAESAKRARNEVAAEQAITVLECETMVDHVHVLLAAESDSELAWFMKLLKGRSAYEVFKAMPELRLDAATNALWQRGYASRVISPHEVPIVSRYIRTQDERLEKYER